jgi:hypothetical protein
MTCSVNQCCAISNFNRRCVNSVVNGSNHCELHRPKAKELYLAYKKLSDTVDKLDIHKGFEKRTERIKYVMKCYNLLNKTFDARFKHRKYAFVPECYDEGHDYQFIKLKQLMKECENILGELYSIDFDNQDSEEKEDRLSDEEIYEEKIEEIPRRINKHIRHRKNVENDTDIWINKYTQENQEILNKRVTLINHIIKISLELMSRSSEIDEDDEDEDEDDITESAFVKCVIIYNLTYRLHNMGYLTKDNRGQPLKGYVPNKCKCCNGYEAVDLLLSCKCIFENNTLLKYFSLPTIESLTEFFRVLLYNKERILAVAEDIKYLYMIYEDNLLFQKLYLIWDPLKSRLAIQENPDSQMINPSKIMKLSRLNKKAYDHQIDKIKYYV